MSVEVQNLTKIYGAQKAIDNLSFRIETGEIVGFLGPNGAGKTTTMKIITCFLPQTEGTANVCGYDVEKQSMDARKQIGYLPEHNPLYPDMYVREYLEFVAGLHRLGSGGKGRIEDMIQLTGLERESRKKIGQLSKGYRQRVGLAQAMLHDPKVLVLDEPTSGLDPNQLAEIRQVIKTLGKEKTVILSTHIMQEVQQMCDRILIINQGELVADDSASALKNRVEGNSSFKVEFQSAVNEADLALLPNIAETSHLGNNWWRISTDNNEDIRADIFQLAVQKGLVLLSLQKEENSIEDVFRQLTNKND